MKDKILGDYIEINGYKVTYGFLSDYWSSLDYSSSDESEDERRERLLREKAIARENKINQILGE